MLPASRCTTTSTALARSTGRCCNGNGFESEVATSRAAWAERDLDGAIDAISDEMVHEIQVIGPLESVREQLQERSQLGADVQMLYMPQGDAAEVGKRLEALLK